MRLHLMQVARGGGLKGLTVDALVTAAACALVSVDRATV